MHLHAYIVNVKCFINFGTHCVHNIHHYHYDFSEIRPCTYALFKFLHNGLNIHIHAHVHTCTIVHVHVYHNVHATMDFSEIKHNKNM